MKLIKTIKKIIKEAEEQYLNASETNMSLEELDRLERHYRDSLKLLSFYTKKMKSQKHK